MHQTEAPDERFSLAELRFLDDLEKGLWRSSIVGVAKEFMLFLKEQRSQGASLDEDAICAQYGLPSARRKSSLGKRLDSLSAVRVRRIAEVIVDRRIDPEQRDREKVVMSDPAITQNDDFNRAAIHSLLSALHQGDDWNEDSYKYMATISDESDFVRQYGHESDKNLNYAYLTDAKLREIYAGLTGGGG